VTDPGQIPSRLGQINPGIPPAPSGYERPKLFGRNPGPDRETAKPEGIGPECIQTRPRSTEAAVTSPESQPGERPGQVTPGEREILRRQPQPFLQAPAGLFQFPAKFRPAFPREKSVVHSVRANLHPGGGQARGLLPGQHPRTAEVRDAEKEGCPAAGGTEQREGRGEIIPVAIVKSQDNRTGRKFSPPCPGLGQILKKDGRATLLVKNFQMILEIADPHPIAKRATVRRQSSVLPGIGDAVVHQN
jgi:hypothetical protein